MEWSFTQKKLLHQGIDSVSLTQGCVEEISSVLASWVIRVTKSLLFSNDCLSSTEYLVWTSRGNKTMIGPDSFIHFFSVSHFLFSISSSEKLCSAILPIRTSNPFGAQTWEPCSGTWSLVSSFARGVLILTTEERLMKWLKHCRRRTGSSWLTLNASLFPPPHTFVIVCKGLIENSGIYA